MESSPHFYPFCGFTYYILYYFRDFFLCILRVPYAEKVVLNRVFIMWLNSLTFLGLSRNTSRKALEFSRDLTGIWHRNRANFPAISLPNIFQKPLEFFRGLPGTFPKIIWTFSGNFSQNTFPKSAELFLGISPEYGTETALISQRFPSRISSRNRSNFSG